jgi:ornithine cyclodeaminase
VVELWRVLSGEVAGRQDAAQVTVFDSVGFALEDFSALRYLRDVTDARNIGEHIELIPAPLDPKNLYQFVVPATAAATATTTATAASVATSTAQQPVALTA